MFKSIRNIANHVKSSIGDCIQKYSTRRRLHYLDSRLLKDIGLTQSDVTPIVYRSGPITAFPASAKRR